MTPYRMTPRRFDILRTLLANGPLDNDGIAEKMGVPVPYIMSQVGTMYDRTNWIKRARYYKPKPHIKGGRSFRLVYDLTVHGREEVSSRTKGRDKKKPYKGNLIGVNSVFQLGEQICG